MASNMIGNLAVNLTMNTAAFQNGAKNAERRADSLKTKMAGIGASVAKLSGALALGGVAVGAAVLGNMAQSAFELGSSLTEAAAKVGVTVEALQEMRYAATQNGVSIETMDGSLNKMNKTLGELSLGNKTVAENFGLLGLAAKDFIGLSPTESFAKLADALLKVENESERAAIGSKVFGRAYAELKPIINLGAEGIKAAAEEKRKDGIVSEEQARILDDLADGWDKLKEKVGVASAQFIANQASSKDASKGLSDLGSNVIWLVGQYNSATNAIEGFLRRIDAFDAQVSQRIAERLKESALTSWIPGVEGFANSQIDKAQVRLQIATGKVSNGRIKGTGAKPSDRKAPVPVAPEPTSVRMPTSGTRRSAPAGKTPQEIAREKALQDQKALVDRLFPEVKALVDYKADKNNLEEWAKTNKIGADKLSDALVRLRDSYYGVDGPVAVTQDTPFVEDIADSLPPLEDMVNKMAGKLKTTNVTISESFADMAQDVMSSISGLANSIKGGGFLSILEGLVNIGLQLGKIGAFGKNIQTNLNAPAGGRARGGPINSNRTYLVGERGPELFSSSRGGYITANDNMSNSRQSMDIKVIPSPFFETVVDERAKNVAMPLAMRGGLAGASLAESRLASKQRNRIP